MKDRNIMDGWPMQVYVDTSVFGGVFDPEFERASKAFFDRVRDGAFEVVVSPVVLAELKLAPPPVRQLFDELEASFARVDPGEAAYTLRRAYLDAHVVGAKWAADALHVATATVSGCRAIISWNFKHIVNFKRIPMYNGVNQMQGYGPIAIHSPQEVIFDVEEEEL
jgi:predicted nucleic acid-binding protein